MARKTNPLGGDVTGLRVCTKSSHGGRKRHFSCNSIKCDVRLFARPEGSVGVTLDAHAHKKHRGAFVPAKWDATPISYFDHLEA